MESINDAMFLVNVGTQTFPDFPSRAHGFAFGINFNDGHADIRRIIDTKNWTASTPAAGKQDWTWVRERTSRPKN